MVVNHGWTEVITAVVGDRFSSSTVGARAYNSWRRAVCDGLDEHVDLLLRAGHFCGLVGG